MQVLHRGTQTDMETVTGNSGMDLLFYSKKEKP